MECIAIYPVHYPTREQPAKKARPVKAESYNLHYHINDFNPEKIPAQVCAMGATH